MVLPSATVGSVISVESLRVLCVSDFLLGIAPVI